jgi:hypothetical protein
MIGRGLAKRGETDHAQQSTSVVMGRMNKFSPTKEANSDANITQTPSSEFSRILTGSQLEHNHQLEPCSDILTPPCTIQTINIVTLKTNSIIGILSNSNTITAGAQPSTRAQFGYPTTTVHHPNRLENKTQPS